MKRFAMFMAAAVALGTVTIYGSTAQAEQAGAQTGAHPRVGQRRIGRLAQALGLTDAQKAQIKSILQAQRPKVQAVRQNSSLSPEEKKSQLKAIGKETRAQIAAILTPEQKQKLAELRKRHQGGRHGDKNAANKPAPGGATSSSGTTDSK